MRLKIPISLLFAALLAVAVFAVAGGDGESATGPHTVRSAQSVAELEANRFIADKDRTPKPEFVPDEVMVRFKSSATKAQRRAARRAAGAKLVKQLPVPGLELLAIAQSSTVAETREKLAEEDAVDYAEPNFIRELAVTPNDTSFNQLWGLNNTGQTVNGVTGVADADIDAPEAWNTFTGSSSAVVAVIDTGIDATHPDLAANVWTNPGESGGGKETNGLDDDGNGLVDDYRGWDFVGASVNSPTPDNNPADTHDHGTHVSGTIAGVGNNGQGVAGVAWQAKVMPLRIFDNNDSTTSDVIIQAFNYAASKGAKVANGSFGGGGFSQAEQDALQAAPNTLWAFAAGNNAGNNDATTYYPCGYNVANIVCTAASTSSDALSSFSNYGATQVDIAAPGSGVYSSVVGGGYAYFNGTSMASPHVAGALTLMGAYDTTASPAQLKEALLNGAEAKPAFAGKTVTGGRLNVANSLSYLLPSSGTSRVQTGGGRLTYTSGNGVANNLSITLSGSTYTVNDSVATVTVGTGCTSVNSHQATCSNSGVTSVYARLMDQNDTMTSSSATPATVFGGAGNDTITTGSGADTLDGELGNDVFNGGSGSDTVSYEGRTANVTVTINGTANDGASGETDNVKTDIENVVGGSGNDVITGSTAANNLAGKGGNDTLDGGSGNDVLRPGLGTDTVIGNSGTDVADYSDRTSGVTLTLDGVANDGAAGENDQLTTSVEGLTGSGGNDTLTGNSSANTINGGAGDDLLNGGTGADPLNGGTGVDTVDYSSRTTAVTVTINGTANDGVSFEGDNVATDVENLIGGSANDTFTGSSADNTFDGRLGNDVYNGGTGTDTVSYATRTAAVTATINGTANDGVAGETDNVKTDIENLIGGSGNDTFTGSTAANKLLGSAGNDTLSGGDGNDTIDGGDGDDVFNGGNGTDLADYSSRNDWDKFADGLDSGIGVTIDNVANDGRVYPTAEHDNVKTDVEDVNGTIGQDTITGSASNNRLDAGHGEDVVAGGAGNDTLIGGPSVEYQVYGNGMNYLDGGDGDDRLETGQFPTHFVAEPGADTYVSNGQSGSRFSYAARTADITATMDGIANDGAAGEGDNLTGFFTNIEGGQGNDTMSLGTGGGTGLEGGPGNDTLTGNNGWSVLHGDDGDDLLKVNYGVTMQSGFSAYYGEAGNDTVSYALRTSAVSVTLDNVDNDGQAGEDHYVNPSIENVTGTDENDTLIGSSAGNVLDGALGCDTLTGNDGNDDLKSGPPNEDNMGMCSNEITGGNGDDTLRAVGGYMTMLAEPGADTYTGSYTSSEVLDYSARTDDLEITVDGVADDGSAGEGDNVKSSLMKIIAGSGADVMIGSTNMNVFEGGPGTDWLEGAEGDDFLYGDEGDDTLVDGGPDNSRGDALYGGAGVDTASYAGRGLPLTLSLIPNQNNGESGEGDYIASDVENLHGGSAADTLIGNAADNTLLGGYGSDTIDAAGGNDRIEAQDSGDDASLTCGSGTDVLIADLLPFDSVISGCETVTRN